MSINGDIEFTPKRKRYNPQKRWEVAEEKALIEFLLENRDFEKPSARIFYNRFANEKQIVVEWKSARSKIRNMRSAYNKAKEWEGSTGAGSMDGETIRSELLKKFRYFYEFDDIFGARLNACAVVEEVMVDADTSIEIVSPGQIEVPIENRTSIINGQRGIYSRTVASDVMQIHGEIAKLRKQKLEADVAAKEREFEQKEIELELKAKELELKEKEILARKDTAQLELQMKERIAMEELKLKYK